MDHAVAALLVPALPPVVLPLGGVHQLPEGRGIALLEEIARPLPAKEVERGISPGRALVVVLAHEEAEEERRLIELPVLLRLRQHVGEELMGAGAPQEVLLVGGLGVAVAR